MRVGGRLTGVRYAGMGGAVLLAAGAYRVGALPGTAAQPSGLRTGALSSPGYAVAFAACVLGLAILLVSWWSLSRGPAPAQRWVLLTGALWAAPLLAAPPLGSRDVYAYACQGWLWSGGGDPYRDGVAAGGCPWIDSVPPLWRDTATPYGPLALLISGGAAAAARTLPVADGYRLAVAVGLLRLVALGGAVLVAWQGGRLARACGVAPGDVARLAVVTPLAVLHVASGAHHDALVAGVLVAALAVAAGRPGTSAGFAPERERHERLTQQRTGLAVGEGEYQGAAGTAGQPKAPAGIRPTPAGRWPLDGAMVAAGALVGLAAAIKITAVVVLPFVVLLAGRGERDRPERDLPARSPAGWSLGVSVRAALLAVVAAVAAFAVVTLAAGLGLGWVSALRGTTGLNQWTSPPTAVGMTVGYLLSALGWSGGYGAAIVVARVLGVVALAGLVPVLWWRAARAGDPAGVVAATGWALAAVVLLAPVFYPWYLLAPLAVLAAAVPEPKVRRGLAVAVVVASLLVFPDGLGVAVLTKAPGAIAVTVLIAVSAWLALRRPRAPLRPGR